METITFISDLKSTIIDRLNDYAGGIIMLAIYPILYLRAKTLTVQFFVILTKLKNL